MDCGNHCVGAHFFEIGFAFLVWRPRTRWVMIGMAVILHGLIGLFMGLKTFSMIMLVMNMAFLRPEEAHWLLGWIYRPAAPRVPVAPAPALETVGAVSATAVKPQS